MPGHGKPPSFAFRPKVGRQVSFEGYRGRERGFLKYRRTVVSVCVMSGTRVQSLDGVERSSAVPGISASGIHRGTKPVLQCLGSDEKPCGNTAGLRLKRASGPLQRNQYFKLNRSVGAGFEP